MKALTSSGHASKIYTLTGPDSTNGAGYAAKLAAVLDKSVSFTDSPRELLKQFMVNVGFPEDQISAALQVMDSVRANEWDVVSADVETVLGRPATSFEAWARRNSAAFS